MKNCVWRGCFCNHLDIQCPSGEYFNFTENKLLWGVCLKEEIILRFEEVSFDYGHNHPHFKRGGFFSAQRNESRFDGPEWRRQEHYFSAHHGRIETESGKINTNNGITIATAKQVIPRDQMELTVREFFEKCFSRKVYDIDPRIDEVLEVVNLKGHEKLHDRIIKSFSGGQQARLLFGLGAYPRAGSFAVGRADQQSGQGGHRTFD